MNVMFFFKTPKFWENINRISKILLPISFIYWIIFRINEYFTIPYISKIPIICVGGITVGGSGKTPVAISVGKLLKKMNRNIYFVSRGYKGKLDGPVLVSETHTAFQVGDEPIILSSIAPTIVSKNRLNGIKLAEKMGADIIVMDDGMQNYSVNKNFTICVVDDISPFGNGLLIPSGPLREKISHANKIVDCLVIMGVDKEKSNKSSLNLIQQKFPNAHKINAYYIAANELNIGLAYGFAGIAYPEKFYLSLEKAGIDLVKVRDFPDHYIYSDTILKDMIFDAKKYGLTLVTTEKDYVKIPEKYKSDIFCFNVYLDLDYKKLRSLMRHKGIL